MMPDFTVLYCENMDCRVFLFDASEEQNCPGCGQYGRKKGKQ